jgi:membrane peptidoglycan carboxypeptidase
MSQQQQHEPAPLSPSRPRRRGLFLFLLSFFALALLALTVFLEIQTSWFQSRYFAGLARELQFRLETGPSASIRFPGAAPYDQRLGYSELPGYIERLQNRGFEIESQARLTARLSALIEAGYAPPYREKAQAGLRILDCRTESLFAFTHPERVYPEFEAIPQPIVSTLLFIENRELLDDSQPNRNPAVEWVRLGRAVFSQFMKLVALDYDAPGGSTLATQIEKYRHSPLGITTSVGEKARQMYAATLRAYAGGPDTTAARRRIVLEYLNTVPLAAVPDYGEVSGLGDGLWAWFGADFERVNALLAEPAGENVSLAEQGLAYRQAVALLVAHRRPTWFLGQGRKQLAHLTDSYIRLAASAGIIPERLRDAALEAELAFRGDSAGPPRAFVRSWKGANAIRSRLVTTLDVPRVYDLDRLDLSVTSTLDGEMQDAVSAVLRRLQDRSYVRAAHLAEGRLLGSADPTAVIYTFTLFERGSEANYVRVQTDNSSQPFDTNEGAKLELGSTAKLRTLATYLEIIAALHQQYGEMDAKALRAAQIDPRDRLSRWAVDYLTSTSDRSLSSMLEAAMQRRYSASPAETFFTGSGNHTFSNFKREDDAKTPTVQEAMRESINLPFIRIMRDVVYHYVYRPPDNPGRVLQDRQHPDRNDYLQRFADHEGRVFIRHFYRKYQPLKPEQVFDHLIEGLRPAPVRYAVIFRSVFPEADLADFSAYMRARFAGSNLTDQALASLYSRYGIDRYDLQDRGYLARVHPLELWLVAYLQQNPGATLAQVIEASREERQIVYQWLFRSKARAAQDSRIRTALEMEAFTEIHAHWRRLGYPFGALVPSYATAIGVSGDRPAALAELLGIILNEGVRLPTARMEELRFAQDTPYETVMRFAAPGGEQVMRPEVAAALKRSLTDVVENGTARRLRGAFKLADKSELTVGGKTGTGDNRVDVYGSGGQLIRSRAVSRTATFAFFIGDRFFGVITAYVPGETAQNYNFTSALPVQILRNLAPELAPYLEPANPKSCGRVMSERLSAHTPPTPPGRN